MTYEIPWDEEPGFRADLLRYLLPQLPVGMVEYMASSPSELEMPVTRLITALGTASNNGIKVPAAWKDKIHAAVRDVVDAEWAWQGDPEGCFEDLCELFEKNGDFYDPNLQPPT